ncbi:exodeoxyribonuclease VII large subunit [Microseira sp. BLCC-F43]|jgi:exodeoxyribonuclease VII large subunit|uniref:exodeoxyribonuclease VII large subunit n=1 Tax=Microseira sp. BLCC-F43 TaxID=3153602 RepID=UPI0035B8DD83
MSDLIADALIPETAISVAGLTDYIRFLLEQDDQLRQVWVFGEVSSINRHRSGRFFTLQDSEGKAAISCVVWTNQIDRLAKLPVPGEQIVVLGSIRLYPQRGQYQITVWQALPAGVGLRSLRYRQLRSRLEAEGLFAPERKRSLPTHPQTIAVVTSPQAAAWGDIQRTLKQRYPGLQVLFSPAQVQGEQAPLSIVRAIERVVRDARAEVIILSRGGGAVEDLECFNDERVVRAIATSPIPIVTGIGHQRDESLADLVADVCAHTPTAAAELVVPELAELYIEHRQRIAALREAVNQQKQAAEGKIEQLRSRLLRLRLNQQVEREKEAIDLLRQQLIQSTRRRLEQATQHCNLLRQKLATLAPQAVLQRGYAVAREEDGSIVRSSTELALGKELLIQLGQGRVKVKVIEILD